MLSACSPRTWEAEVRDLVAVLPLLPLATLWAACSGHGKPPVFILARQHAFVRQLW